jgi:hypothetical protein
VSELQWVVLVFDSPVICAKDSLVIGSRLDADLNTKSCRLAFYGCLSSPMPSLADRWRGLGWRILQTRTHPCTPHPLSVCLKAGPPPPRPPPL